MPFGDWCMCVNCLSNCCCEDLRTRSWLMASIDNCYQWQRGPDCLLHIVIAWLCSFGGKNTHDDRTSLDCCFTWSFEINLQQQIAWISSKHWRWQMSALRVQYNVLWGVHLAVELHQGFWGELHHVRFQYRPSNICESHETWRSQSIEVASQMFTACCWRCTQLDAQHGLTSSIAYRFARRQKCGRHDVLLCAENLIRSKVVFVSAKTSFA